MKHLTEFKLFETKSIEVGDKFYHKDQKGGIANVTKGEVIEVSGEKFKLKDKFGGKDDKWRNLKDYPKAKITKESKLFEYTEADKRKDIGRIEDMWQKAKDEDHMLRLAQTMANSIKNAEKAYNRGRAAENENFHKVAKIFFDRADELGW